MPHVKILIPMDGTASSKQAPDCICWLFEAERSRVTLLRVAPRPTGFSIPTPALMVVDGWARLMPNGTPEGDKEPTRHPVSASYVWDRFQAELKDGTSGGLGCLRKAGFQVSMAVRLGEPVEEIADYVATEGIDLVIMATPGGSAMRRALRGSVAQGVLDRVAVPVMMLPTRVEPQPAVRDWAMPQRGHPARARGPQRACVASSEAILGRQSGKGVVALVGTNEARHT